MGSSVDCLPEEILTIPQTLQCDPVLLPVRDFF